MISKQLLLVAFLLLLSLTVTQAQDIVIRGLISDQQTGRPLEAANITLQTVPGSDVFGTTSDSNGFFYLGKLNSGKYIFKVRYVGFETYIDTLYLEDNTAINVALSYAEVQEEVTVIVSRIENLDPGQTRINSLDLQRVPTPGGNGDIAGFLQTQPGVVMAGDRGGQLFIRGGIPSENMVLMDGSLIYQPFHIVGFFSVFPEEVISKADLFAGGFGPRYSGRTSSVLDVRLQNGNLYDRNWSASMSPFISDLFFESPLVEGKSSVLISLRGSLIESTSQFYPERQPLRFNSQLLKYSSISERGMNCSIHILRTYDRGKLDYDMGDFYKWSNFVSGGGCSAASNNSKVSYLDLNFGVSYFSNEAGRPDLPIRFSSVTKSFIDFHLVQYLFNWRLDYGFLTSYNKLHYDIASRFASVQASNTVFLNTSAYLKLSISVADKLSFEPGLSYTSYVGKLKGSLEPRLKLSWQPRGNPGEEIHAALGIYYQPLIGVSDYRDIGTAFTAWMLIPDKDRKLQSNHAIIGWRQPLNNHLKLSVEGYYKKMSNIPVSEWHPSAQFSTDLSYADGFVYGTDFRLDFYHSVFFGGIGYGYSLTEYKVSQEHFLTWLGKKSLSYNPPHDRRHQINIQAGFKIENFTTKINWMYGSGMPFTQPMGFDSYFSFRNGPPQIKESYGEPRVLLESPFAGMLPAFHRLDVSVEQTTEIRDVKVNIIAGVVNAYNWKNLFYYDVYSQKSIMQLPFLPYITLKIGSI